MENAQTLDRGLRVLFLLSRSSDGLSVPDLALALDVSRTVVYRLTSTLETHALIRRGADSRFRIGFGVIGLSDQLVPELRAAAATELLDLAQRIGETVGLAIADGTDGVVIAVAAPPRREVWVDVRVGNRAPLETTAYGRAMRAGRLEYRALARTAVGKVMLSEAGGRGPCETAVAVPGLKGVDAAVVSFSFGPLLPAQVEAMRIAVAVIASRVG